MNKYDMSAYMMGLFPEDSGTTKPIGEIFATHKDPSLE